MRVTAFITAIATGILVSAKALAAAVTIGSLTLSGLWTTATPPGAPTAAAYLSITNNGAMSDSLVAVSSPVASLGMLHRMDVSNAVATMQMVPEIEIPPGKTVTLAPDRFHIMFVTLKQPLKAGDAMPVTLIFQRAGRVDARPGLSLGRRVVTHP